MPSNYQITVTLEGRDNLSDNLRQLNQTLTQVETNTRNTSDGVNRMENSFSNLRTGLTNANNLLNQFGLGLSAMGIMNVVGDLGELGREVNAVETTFEQLSGGTEAAAQSLQNMRDRTGGVVDDFTLMSGANQLLLTGLASTNDQAAELVDLGYRLSAAMGVDAKEGIENLNAALLNNSYARLDTLGISAAQVRARVEELKESGMDMSEAFSTAVLEQGREKLELLGEAANTGETAFNRLRTQLNNAKGGLAEFTAEGIEAGAQLLELVGLAGQFGIGNVVTAAQGGEVNLGNQQMAQDALAIRDERLGDGYARSAVDTEALVEMAQTNPDLFNRISSGSAFTTMTMGSEQATVDQTGMPMESMKALFEDMTGSPFDGLMMDQQIILATELDTQLSAVAATVQQVAAAEADAERQQLALNDALSLASEREQEYADLEAARLANQEAANRAASEEQQIFESLNDSYGELTQSATEFQSLGGVQIMDAGEADEIINRADSMQQRFEELEQIAEDTEFQYISEDELAWAEEMTNQANELADEAQRAAAAFEAMSLTDLFGQSDGGRLGELSDMVIDAAVGNIEDPEQQAAARAELEQQYNMASGRETDVSVAFEEQIVPLLADITTQLGDEAGIGATERALTALEEGRLAGLTGEELINSIVTAIGITQGADGTLTAATSLSGADMTAMVNGDVPMGYGGSNYSGTGYGGDMWGAMTQTATMNPGDAAAMTQSVDYMPGEMPMGFEQGGVDAVMEQLTVLDEMTMTTTENVNLLASTDLSPVMAPMVHDMETVQSAAAVIKAKLDSMAASQYRTTLVLDVQINDPTGMFLGMNPAFSNAVGTTTSNNGGSPVGAAAGGGPS